MNLRKIGRTDLAVSGLGLGAMQFGWLTNEENSLAILDAYHAAGGNFIQTAALGHCQDLRPGLCRSEEIVGAWLRANPRARDGLVLSTRMHFAVSGHGIGLAESVRRQCEESLRRLRTSHLDLLVCEWGAALRPIDEVFGACDDLMRAGKLRHVGAAGFSVWRFMEALGRSTRLGRARFESFQADFSLLERTPVEPDAVELAAEYRVAILAQSPLAGGFLTGCYRLSHAGDTARSRRLHERYGNAHGHLVLAALDDIAGELGVTPAQVALAWVLTRPGITAPLLGFATPAQVDEAVAAMTLELTATHLERLEQASGRPPVATEPLAVETITP